MIDGGNPEVRSHFGCLIPEDLLYDIEHDIWVRREGDEAVVGMTDPAQTRCGKIVAIQLKAPGKRVARGRGVATIESAKWVGALPSPVSGEILANNEASFRQDLLVANRDPYGRGWLVRIRMSDPTELEDLTPGDAAFELYKAKIDELELRCFRCADDPVPMM